MKKDDDLNPGEEFFYKLSQKPEFERDLKKMRSVLGIPKNGFTNREGRRRCLSEPRNVVKFIVATEYLQREHKIPVTYISFVDHYIFFGDRAIASQDKPSVATIEPPAHTLGSEDINMEDYYRDSGEPYAKLLIFGNGSKSDVLKFINKNWSEVEKIIEKQRGFPRKRIRKTLYKDRNRLIKLLSHKSIKELQNEAGLNSKYKDILINSILKKRGYGEVNEGYIRKIISEK